MSQRRVDVPAWIAVFVLLLAGCSSGPESVEPASTTPGAESVAFLQELSVQETLELECTGTTTIDPPDNFEVVHDAVALPSSPDHPALQTSARETTDGSTYYFAKTGLFWRANSSFELVIPEEHRSGMAIGWGGPAPHAHSIAVNCDGADEWVVLAGGYWVTEPVCADLIVRSEGNERTVQIGLGKPCDDQPPPQGPSFG